MRVRWHLAHTDIARHTFLHTARCTPLALVAFLLTLLTMFPIRQPPTCGTSNSVGQVLTDALPLVHRPCAGASSHTNHS